MNVSSGNAARTPDENLLFWGGVAFVEEEVSLHVSRAPVCVALISVEALETLPDGTRVGKMGPKHLPCREIG